MWQLFGRYQVCVINTMILIPWIGNLKMVLRVAQCSNDSNLVTATLPSCKASAPSPSSAFELEILALLLSYF